MCEVDTEEISVLLETPEYLPVCSVTKRGKKFG